MQRFQHQTEIHDNSEMSAGIRTTFRMASIYIKARSRVGSLLCTIPWAWIQAIKRLLAMTAQRSMGWLRPCYSHHFWDHQPLTQEPDEEVVENHCPRASLTSESSAYIKHTEPKKQLNTGCNDDERKQQMRGYGQHMYGLLG